MKEPKRSSALVRRETFASYCFLLPSLIFFLGFVIYPMILCVVTSFFDSTMNRADIFVGMANYKTLFADPIFLGALKNTFVIVIVSDVYKRQVYLYDEKVLITFNYKDVTKTITFDESAAKDAPEGNGDVYKRQGRR